jgi:alcohol dehydrogenase class IV
MRFEFSTATKIIFGLGTLREAGPLAKESGTRALVVTGSNSQRAEPLLSSLRATGVDAILFAVRGEPEVKTVQIGTELAKREGCDLVISLGGGSAIDTGKAIAAMLTNAGDLLDYLEIIGRGKALTKASAPFIAIPTTAGTGAEVTRNAVLASPEHRLKVSLRSPFMLPKVALVDPELTYDLPPAITASTGLDALTQLIEPYVCSRANPMTDVLCVEGIRRARSLRKAFENGQDLSAREDMALASLLGGLALANAGLGAVHGFAGPLGGMFPEAPHGALCAALLPHVMEMNIRALQQRQPASTSLRRYEEVAHLLTSDSSARAEDGIAWVRNLVKDLNIPRLAVYGIQPQHTLEVIEKAAGASSMKANPIVLTPAELTDILQLAL